MPPIDTDDGAVDRWNHRTVRASGLDLHCVEAGNGSEGDRGRLMLFLHGFPEFWYSWRHQLGEFAADFHAVAPDLRGYNKSDRPESRSAYRLEHLVDDVKELIFNLGYERCILVGHDWGGAIAWEFAHAHPEMLDTLVVMNAPHPVRFYEAMRTPSQLRRSWYIFFFQLPWLPEKLLSRQDCEAVAELFASQAKNPDAFSAADLEAYRRAACRTGALSAMLNYYRGIPSTALTFKPRDYTPISVPTLLLWGEDDAALGKELTYDMQRFFPDLRVEYISDCSHWVQQDRPQIVNELMRSFLADR